MIGNLEFIHQEVITSSTSSVDITNVFSSKYDVYCITATDFSTVGTNATGINVRLINSSGTVISTGSYDNATFTLADNATFVEDKNVNSNLTSFFDGFDQAPDTFGSVAYVFNPYSSTYTFAVTEGSRSDETIYRGTVRTSVLKNTDVITGFRALDSSGTKPFNTGKITVYGVK